MQKKILRRKPIAFDTTLRNPRRIPQFISVLSKFEGKILDDEVALNLEAEIIRQKIFEPTKATLGTYQKNYSGKFKFQAHDQSEDAEKKIDKYFNEWLESSPGEYPRNNIVYLLQNTITKHKEANWNGGWESRIHTQFNFLNELGFVQVVKNKEIKISPNGHLMIREYKNGYPKHDDFSTTFEESSFLNAFVKYQINNPFRRNTIKVNFFPLVLNVINELKEYGYDTGIHIKELPLIISWGNNDYKLLTKLIHEFRQKYGYSASSEVIYKYAMHFMSLESFVEAKLEKASQDFLNKKISDYKFGKIIHETPDEVIRKLRLTMLITLRGGGRFIDINKNEIDKVQHILNKYSTNKSFCDEADYFNYMGSIDPKLIYEEEIDSADKQLEKNNQILNFSKKLGWPDLEKEMLICVNPRKKSSDDVLKYIEKPVRFEFLVSVALKKALPNIIIKANYKADDEGIPFSAASGKQGNKSGADIDLYEDDVHALVEPTISSSESFQVEHELPSIRRHVITSFHIDNKKNPDIKDWFALFITGNVARDVGNQIAIIRDHNNVHIYPWEIKDFIKHSQNVIALKDYKILRHYAKVERIDF